ncbi:josephin-2-like, partial [Pezoporus occidentalis]|uniref:josephin-2-like n=1 Tax=Pezoporus occidentalis TaxID=407982 RepID=UPI002F90F94F
VFSVFLTVLGGFGLRLAPGAWLNPHRSLLGNYDVNVLMAALQGQGLAVLWWDKRRPLELLVLPNIFGFILNVPAGPLLGLIPIPIPVPAPLRRQHWLSLRCFQGVYYNLDSKLPHPEPIGGEEELRAFLRDFLSRGLSELFLVVPRDVEEAGAWLSTHGGGPNGHRERD